jgi:hypothetical protein
MNLSPGGYLPSILVRRTTSQTRESSNNMTFLLPPLNNVSVTFPMTFHSRLLFYYRLYTLYFLSISPSVQYFMWITMFQRIFKV